MQWGCLYFFSHGGSGRVSRRGHGSALTWHTAPSARSCTVTCVKGGLMMEPEIASTCHAITPHDHQPGPNHPPHTCTAFDSRTRPPHFKHTWSGKASCISEGHEEMKEEMGMKKGSHLLGALPIASVDSMVEHTPPPMVTRTQHVLQTRPTPTLRQQDRPRVRGAHVERRLLPDDRGQQHPHGRGDVRVREACRP